MNLRERMGFWLLSEAKIIKRRGTHGKLCGPLTAMLNLAFDLSFSQALIDVVFRRIGAGVMSCQ